MKTLPCNTCEGAGEVLHWRKDGTKVTCSDCEGRGFFESPDLVQLSKAIKGRKPGTVRSKKPEDCRAWFLWRMVRFHSGQDVTLPMTATMAISGDPFKPTLEIAAEMIARHLTGKESIGTARWHHAIHGDTPADASILDMPVANGDKPFAERLELE
tara:strand:+ start:199 stop:666 length:468 start_codon:yes stop_codon:yes gene_type:complete